MRGNFNVNPALFLFAQSIALVRRDINAVAVSRRLPDKQRWVRNVDHDMAIHSPLSLSFSAGSFLRRDTDRAREGERMKTGKNLLSPAHRSRAGATANRRQDRPTLAPPAKRIIEGLVVRGPA